TLQSNCTIAKKIDQFVLCMITLPHYNENYTKFLDFLINCDVLYVFFSFYIIKSMFLNEKILDSSTLSCSVYVAIITARSIHFYSYKSIEQDEDPLFSILSLLILNNIGYFYKFIPLTL